MSAIQESVAEKTDIKSGFVEDIYENYQDYILAILHSNQVNPADAEDILQNVFVYLIQHPLGPRDNIKALLYRIITNDCIDLHRRRQNQQKNLFQYSQQPKRYNKQGPLDFLALTEEIQKMFDLIGKELPAYMSRALLLRFRENKTNEQIAQEMQINKQSVSSYLAVGLKKLRQKVRKKK